MARFPVPTESRLEGLLREAYEFMPGPDMNRLAGIEARLLRTARRPAARQRAGVPWWAILLLAGGAATAAWWVEERFIGPDGAGKAGVPAARQNHAPPAEPAIHERGVPEQAQDGTKDRILYEREAP